MELERQRLLERLENYKKGKTHEITVVFDGAKGGGQSETRTMYGGLSVIYTRLGETADAVIKGMLKRDRLHIVITSDREIQAYAWTHNSVPLNSEDFLNVLSTGSFGELGDVPEPDYPVSQRKGKGSPKPASKKQKAIRRAMEKL